MTILVAGSLWLSLLVLGASAEGADEPLTAVFQEMIDLRAWSDAEYLCLGISAGADGEWRLDDPPRQVVETFEGHPVPVVPASECEVTVDGNRHVATARPAQAFWLESVELTGLSGEVRARHHVDGLYGGSFECAVMKGPGGWKAECRQVGVS